MKEKLRGIIPRIFTEDSQADIEGTTVRQVRLLLQLTKAYKTFCEEKRDSSEEECNEIQKLIEILEFNIPGDDEMII